ncbi:hypothetical protein HY522_10735 [bacterium]|nr:hypothetical protein [bacterium]
MEVASVQVPTPASKLFQRDIQGHKLPPEFPPEQATTNLPGAKETALGIGQNVDVSA